MSNIFAFQKLLAAELVLTDEERIKYFWQPITSALISHFHSEKSRIKDFIEVIRNMPDQQFEKKFKLSRYVCYKLIELFERSDIFRKINEENPGGTKPASAEIHVLSFIWFVTNDVTLRNVAVTFNLG